MFVLLDRVTRYQVAGTKPWQVQNGELQAMINNRIFVTINGQAPVEDMEAFFGALDIRGLSEF
jgi:hypothetical protein